MSVHEADTAGRVSGHTGRRTDLDVLRGVAICAVVALHASWRLLQHAPLYQPAGRVLAFAHLASGFGVPLFLALSAVAMSLRYGEAFGGAGACLRFLGRRALRLLPAYVFWSLASAAMKSPALLWPPQRTAWMLLEGSADIQFYFIPLLFQFYVSWPLLRPLLVSGGTSRRNVALGSAAAISLAAWRQMIPTDASLLPALAIHVAGALWLAHLLADRPERRRPTMIAAAAAGAVALTATTRAFYEMLPPPVSPTALLWASTIFQPKPALYALAVIAVSVAWRSRPPSGSGGRIATAAVATLAALGRRSYAIYLVHLLVASNVTGHLIPNASAESGGIAAALAAFAASFAITLGVSFALGAALERHPALAWLGGGTPVGPQQARAPRVA